VSATCVETTRRNVREFGLSERVQVFAGDLFAALDGLGLDGSLDAIVCNPPYISTRRLETERRDLLRHEPREAFDAGPYGLALHQRVIAEGSPLLREGGWLLCEFGVGQARQIELLFARTRRYGPVKFVHDDKGQARVAMARRIAGSAST
jgi:release factor glutamine methyltransferase